MEVVPNRKTPYKTLTDPWDPTTVVPLDCSLERNDFPPFLMAVIGLILAFILFQIVISPAVTLILLMMTGVGIQQLIEGLATIVEENARILMSANTIGQILGIALPAYLLSRLHSSRSWAFLRMRPSDNVFVVLSIFGLVALTPIVQWLGNVNSQIPMPDIVRLFEESQMELIEQVLQANTSLLFNITVLAVTPAICEELLFRGYVLRQAERGLGVAGGILFTGIIFGFYHLRLSQVIPLSVLGIYLAYLVWRTGSLWPAIIVHFLNNLFSILIGTYISSRPDLNMTDIETLQIPWYILLVGFVVMAGVLFSIQKVATTLMNERIPSNELNNNRIMWRMDR